MSESSLNFDQQLGKQIRQYRIRAGKSQEALGDQIGVTLQQMSKYETGLTKVNAEKLVDIAHALGAKPHDLLSVGTSDKTTRLELNLYAEIAECSTSQKSVILELIKAFRRENG